MCCAETTAVHMHGLNYELSVKDMEGEVYKV